MGKIVGAGLSAMCTIVGTPQYMAPEIQGMGTFTQGAKGYDHTVDLWSLGVMLYILLEGMYPFDGKGLAEQIRRANVTFPEGTVTSVAAQDLVRKLIQANPKRRLSLKGCLN